MSDVLLTTPPHWPDSFRETREYLTDIITGHIGQEQRRQVRTKPRRTVRYAMMELDPTGASILQRTVRQAIGNTALIPMWPMATMVSGVSGAVVTADPTSRGFTVGKQAILFQYPRTAELLVVSAVGGSDVTMTSTTTGTWGAGAWLVPVVEARMQAQPIVSVLGRDAVKVTVEAVCLTDETPATGASRDRGVVMWEPLGASELPLRNVDYEESVVHPLVVSPVPSNDDVVHRQTGTVTTRIVRWEQNILSHAEGASWWAAFDDAIGRFNTFWVPSLTRNLEPTAVLNSGTTTMTIPNIGYTTHLHPNESNRHFFAFRYRGSMTRHRITSATDLGATERLVFTPALSWTVDPALNGVFGWLWYGRLDTDDVTVDWSAPGLGRGQVTLRELAYETPAVA